jgi:hypothetical protein
MNTIQKKILILLAVSFLTPLLATANSGAAYYQNRFPLKTPYEKLVNNRGDGEEDLYGTRNFRAVLNGVVYRGGANNKYNKYGSRSNQNPLPKVGLRNLCEEGFSTAIYLYTTNYASAPKVTSCSSVLSSNQKLNYIQASPHMTDVDARKVLNLIHKRLTSETDKSPIYMHCWNGWHASGLISAYTLKQFCGLSGSQAVSYWDKNTDGNNVGAPYDRLRAKIRAFKPDPKLTISPEVKAAVCPRI